MQRDLAILRTTSCLSVASATTVNEQVIESFTGMRLRSCTAPIDLSLALRASPDTRRNRDGGDEMDGELLKLNESCHA